jgi:hypothetical protein
MAANALKYNVSNYTVNVLPIIGNVAIIASVLAATIQLSIKIRYIKQR